MRISITVGSYNQRRYSCPWIARVTVTSTAPTRALDGITDDELIAEVRRLWLILCGDLDCPACDVFGLEIIP